MQYKNFINLARNAPNHPDNVSFRVDSSSSRLVTCPQWTFFRMEISSNKGKKRPLDSLNFIIICKRTISVNPCTFPHKYASALATSSGLPTTRPSRSDTLFRVRQCLRNTEKRFSKSEIGGRPVLPKRKYLTCNRKHNNYKPSHLIVCKWYQSGSIWSTIESKTFWLWLTSSSARQTTL